jgi:alcohol dehydrogenase class IV
VRELPRHLARLGIKRPLVVTDAGLAATATFQILADVLGGSRAGPIVGALFGRASQPDRIGCHRSRRTVPGPGRCDGVIAFGGGSPLDVGKAARLLARRPGFDLARFYDEPDWAGLAPCVAIPTTAGTGSEVGRSSVITLRPPGARRCCFIRS